MLQAALEHNTFVIDRLYAKAPSVVYAAFADPAQKRRWFAEGEHHDLEVFELDFRVGGRELTQSRFKQGTPFAGVLMTSDATFLDLVPDRRIVAASTMTIGDQRISAALTTFDFVPSRAGTKLVFTHQGVFFEGSDGPQRREAGWRSILGRLTRSLGE